MSKQFEATERSVIGVYHLTKKYGDMIALDDVSLTVANGEFVFLVGPSGAGKSTLLRMIYMDEQPTEGQVSSFRPGPNENRSRICGVGSA